MPRCLLILFTACWSLAQDLPRPEYPQPQFQRTEWINLNGRWDFGYDEQLGKTILVPFAPETRLSGIGDTSFHPIVWYRRAFSVPPAWTGKHVLLHFGAVDYQAKVWLNGQAAGAHEGGNVPFTFDITALLKPGTNTLTVRAFDPPTDRYIPRGKQYWEPRSRGIFYTRTTGIWQTVWIEPVAAAHLERVRTTADGSGNARFEARIAPAEMADLSLRTTLAFGKVIVATQTVPVTEGRATAGMVVADPHLWSPGSPNLYDVTWELVRAGQVLDRVQSYLGFRTVSVERGRVTLNGRPIYLKFILDQGYWPDSTLTPPSDEAIQYDIRTSREMGFNGARKHQKVEDPRFLYWADRLGYLVSGEIANAYLFEEQYVQRFTREWMEAVERDYNHPSVIIWVPINESWGVPDLHDRKQQDHLRGDYFLTHSLDATRLVIDNDGWEHTGNTDLFAIHDYARNGDILADKYKNLGKPGAGVPDNARPALAPGFEYNGSPVYLSEFGGIAYIPQGAVVPKESWGYAGVEKSEEDAFDRLRSLYNGIARTPGIVGICYTQLTEVEQEINGLLTYDRKPKFAAAKLRALNDLLHF